MLDFIMLVGLPGSGKSTYRGTIENIEDYVVISSDDYLDAIAIAEGKTYSDVFADHAKAADKHCRAAFSRAIAERKNIIVDRTNLTPNARASFLASLPKEYVCRAVVFSVGMETLKARLEERAARTGKHIPHAVIARMMSSYIEPELDEGFASIATNVTRDKPTGWGSMGPAQEPREPLRPMTKKPFVEPVVGVDRTPSLDDDLFLDFVAECWGTSDTIEDNPGIMNRLLKLAALGADYKAGRLT